MRSLDESLEQCRLPLEWNERVVRILREIVVQPSNQLTQPEPTQWCRAMDRTSTNPKPATFFPKWNDPGHRISHTPMQTTAPTRLPNSQSRQRPRTYEFFEGMGKALEGLDLTREPLRRLIPHLAELQRDPATVLAQRPITIKATPPYGFATFVSLFVTPTPHHYLFVKVLQINPQGPGNGLFFLFWLLGSALLGVVVGGRIYRGKVVLGPEGVEFRDRRSCVRCPWAVFYTPGAIRPYGEAEILIPVQPNAVPLIREYRRGRHHRTGRSARNSCFAFHPDGRAVVVPDRFLAKGKKLAELIGNLGLRLGTFVT